MKNDTPAPAAGSEELRAQLEIIIWFFEDDYADGESPAKDKSVAETVDKIMHLISAQNDATYAAVMEAIKNLSDDYIEDIENWKYYEDYRVNAGDFIRGYNIANRELRQTIAKIFNKEPDSPAGAEGDLR